MQAFASSGKVRRVAEDGVTLRALPAVDRANDEVQVGGHCDENAGDREEFAVAVEKISDQGDHSGLVEGKEQGSNLADISNKSKIASKSFADYDDRYVT